MSRANDFNNLANRYQQTNIKPDKLFSILPTVLRMAGNVKGKSVLDVGCGGGFFTEALAAEGAERVYGLDNSEEQLALASMLQSPGCEYVLGDMFTSVLPSVDLIVAPFVLNYPESVGQLERLLTRFFEALKKGGALVSVIDLPTGNDLSRFGARKTLPEGNFDGAPLRIELFNEGQLITTLRATYFRPETIEELCRKVGLTRFTWIQPVISPEGKRQLGAEFWGNYLEMPELGYFKARKR